MADTITLPVPLFELGHYLITVTCLDCNRKFSVASLKKKKPPFCVYCSSRNLNILYIYRKGEFRPELSPSKLSTVCDCGLAYAYLEEDVEALCVRCNLDLKYRIHHGAAQLAKRQAQAQTG